MKMLWGDWEENGYHDSYFYAAVWDTETQECTAVSAGATAYSGGFHLPETVEWTDEQLELARQWLAKKIFVVLRAAEDRDVLTPNKIEKGNRVQLLEQHKNQAFTTVMAECPNCYGKGYWQNPNRDEDKRECFKCKGACVVEAKGDKIKGQWHRFEAGVVGTVLWSGAFGTFYRNGYNKPGRENITATIKLDDGRFMKAPLSKLRLEKPVDTDTAIMERAEELSYEMNPYSLLTNFKAWWTHNYAAGMMNRKRQREAV